MKLIDNIKNIVLNPIEFFNQDISNIKESFTYYAILSAFFVVLSSIVAFLISTSSFKLTSILLTYLATIAGIFISTLILLIWLIIWRAKINYNTAFGLEVYAATPNLLLGWIPIVGSLAQLYSFVLLIVGTKEITKFSYTKTVLIYLIHLILIIIILLVLGVSYNLLN
jgi:hypothetical protein